MKLSASTQQRLTTKYGKWAVVTGASSGIGKALATQLASSGFDLMLVARREALLETLADELRDQYHVRVNVTVADLGSQEGIDITINAAKSLEVGLLVQAAGFGTSGAFVDADVSAEINMLQVNCNALLQLSHHFGQRFAKARRGGMILLSSMVGFQGVPFAANYAATKAYVQSLAEAIAVELKPYNVDVLSAAPGPVNSGFADVANMQMGKALTPEDVAVPILKALGRKSTVLPGFLTKFLVGSLRTLPRWGKIRVMKTVMSGMTKHQNASAV